MHLAQLNIGRLVDDPDSTVVAEFMNALEAINLLAEASVGYVWRLKDDDGPGAVDQRFPGHEHDDRMLINLTVWTDFDRLHRFVTRSGHGMYLRRRREWFEPASEPTAVLWWIDEGREPNLAEAAQRLALLRSEGATPRAFYMKTRFPAPSGAGHGRIDNR